MSCKTSDKICFTSSRASKIAQLVTIIAFVIIYLRYKLKCKTKSTYKKPGHSIFHKPWSDDAKGLPCQWSYSVMLHIGTYAHVFSNLYRIQLRRGYLNESNPWAEKVTPSLFIEVPFPSQEIERSCICVYFAYILPLYTIDY